jgi:hypothetical protein
VCVCVCVCQKQHKNKLNKENERRDFITDDTSSLSLKVVKAVSPSYSTLCYYDDNHSGQQLGCPCPLPLPLFP